MNYIDGVGGNQSHLHNVFLKFSNPECEHKAAMDKSKKLLSLYNSAASNNIDLQTWLDWMSRKKGTYFETIDVIVPDNVSEEEMYLMVAASTNPHKKIIVGSHQYWKNFCYLNGCNKISYKNREIIILDQDEAFKELNSNFAHNISITNYMDKKNNPWKSGSFYLFSILLLIGIIIGSALLLSIYALPFVIIGGLLLFSVVGAFQLRNDERLSEKSFIQLMVLTFKQIPFLKGPSKRNMNK